MLSFAGAVQNPTPLPAVSPPAPVVCGPNCQEFQFNLGSPAGGGATPGAAGATPAATPAASPAASPAATAPAAPAAAPAASPVLVSLKSTVSGPNATFNANDGFDLYVYDPSGRLAGAGNGIGADGQSLELTSPAPGTYTIAVTFTYAEDPNAGYTGEVRLMKPPAWQPPACTQTTVSGTAGCFELPTLRALPAYDLAVSGVPPVASTPLGFPFPVSTPTPTSCYADESLGLDSPSVASLSAPITRCLRFTTDVQNVGAGAVEVRIPNLTTGGATPTSGYLPGGCEAQQVVTASDGTQVTRPAGPCEFHPEHAHFHYKDLLSYGLYKPAAGGGIGALVSRSQKESFCLSDDDYFGFATPGPNGPRQYVGQPGCNLPAEVGSNGAYVDEGVSPGWGDVYTWDTPDQFIDISTTPAGIYDLVETTNPAGSILVAGAARTCSVTQLSLTATSVQALSSQTPVTCPAG